MFKSFKGGIWSPVTVIHLADPVHATGDTLICREERIESSGPLGSAVTANPYLEQVQAELTAAGAAGVMKGDAFGLYLTALMEIDR